jgi:2-polyprenyl-6-hydroxyphenyl methylase / 3-demethylubiquinone-9 3-methyltransferase
MPKQSSASIEDDEIAQFSRHAEDWWNPNGVFKPLHRMNPVRLGYIRDQVCTHFDRNTSSHKPLNNLHILDVGCGGGLLTEPMARMGGIVTGIDASAEGIRAARDHAKKSNLNIEYQAESVEYLAKKMKAQKLGRFDIITALEIVEHVADLDSFLSAISRLLKPNGILIMSTLNRTAKSFLVGIIAAEYILRWVPTGTHQWKKFIRPSELVEKAQKNSLRTTDLTGMIFSPLTGEFELRANNLGVNYMLTATRQ